MRGGGALGRGAAAVGSGVLFALAQPGFGLWPLAFVCFVPLLAAWRGESLRMRVGLAWVMGTVGTTLATWGAGSAGAESYFGLSPVLAGLVAFAVGQLFGALSFVGLALVAGDPLERGGGAAVFRFAAGLAGVELLRGTLLTGFPWLLLAYSLLPVPELAGAAAVAGATGVSLLLGGIQVASLLSALSDRSRASAAGAGLLAVIALVAPGAMLAPDSPTVVRAGSAEPAPGMHRILLVQPGRISGERPGVVAETAALARQTEEAPPFELAVWPENALAASVPANLHLLRSTLDRRPSSSLIFGAPRSIADTGRVRTSAILLDANGEVRAHHDKVHLLPFAEYAPGPLPMRWFGAWEVEPGEEAKPIVVGDVSYGILLCYEVLFAGLAREHARGGADVLLNLSNDGWFGNTGAVEQHLAAAMYRAIETGRPVLRSTHTGITAAIDADGRVLGRLPLDEAGSLRVDVSPRKETTPAIHWGDAPVWIAFAFVVASGAVRGLRARAAAEERPSVEV